MAYAITLHQNLFFVLWISLSSLVFYVLLLYMVSHQKCTLNLETSKLVSLNAMDFATALLFPQNFLDCEILLVALLSGSGIPREVRMAGNFIEKSQHFSVKPNILLALS